MVGAVRMQEALSGLHVEAKDVLTGVWGDVNRYAPERIRDTFLQLTPDVTELYGGQAAVLAADWYDALRADAGVRSGFRSELAPVIEREFVERRVRFGAKTLWADAMSDTFLLFIHGAVTGWITTAFGTTIEQNTARDRTARGFIRKPSPGACNFCMKLASRAAYWNFPTGYGSAQAATTVVGRGRTTGWATDKLGRTQRRGGGIRGRGTQPLGDPYHDNCRCTAVPVWDGIDIPKVHGFDPADLYDRYRQGEFGF